MSAVLLVSAVGEAEGSLAAAAALACAVAGEARAALLADLDPGREPRPTLVASAGARALEECLAAELPDARAAARGALCHAALPAGRDGLETALELAAALPRVVHSPPSLLHEALDACAPFRGAALLRADLRADRSLTALAIADLHARGLRARVLKRPLGWLAARRALAGALPLGAAAGLPARLVDGLEHSRRVRTLPPPASPETAV